MIDKKNAKNIEVIPVKKLSQVLEHAFVIKGDKEGILEKIKDFIPAVPGAKGMDGVDRALPKKHGVL